MKEYATLTELMSGREPGCVKVALRDGAGWLRIGSKQEDGWWSALDESGGSSCAHDSGPWLLVSEDPPALDTVRLEIAARLLGSLYAAHNSHVHGDWENRHAYALAEADALIAGARK